MVRVLVTGSEGYLGSVLTPMLVRDGHDVTRLDAGWFSDGLLAGQPSCRPVKTDLQMPLHRLSLDVMPKVDAVVHLAELSNDSVAATFTDVAAIMSEGSLRLAELARAVGASKFIYLSSCAVYGACGDDVVDEHTVPCPESLYAKCKMEVEAGLERLSGSDFSPIILRCATIFGLSPNMRFDLLLNTMVGAAWAEGGLTVHSGGLNWRPLVHVRDVADCIAHIVEASPGGSPLTLNLGSTENNFRILDVGNAVADKLGVPVRITEGEVDPRSYRVRCDRLKAQFPDFSCRRTLEDGALEIYRHLAKTDPPNRRAFVDRFSRVTQLRARRSELLLN